MSYDARWLSHHFSRRDNNFMYVTWRVFVKLHYLEGFFFTSTHRSKSSYTLPNLDSTVSRSHGHGLVPFIGVDITEPPMTREPPSASKPGLHHYNSTPEVRAGMVPRPPSSQLRSRYTSLETFFLFFGLCRYFCFLNLVNLGCQSGKKLYL